MADSWEDGAEENIVMRPQAKTASLNPNAASFSFNPGASSFTPTFAPPPAVPSPPAPAAQMPAPQPDVVMEDSAAATPSHVPEEPSSTGADAAAEQLQQMQVDEAPSQPASAAAAAPPPQPAQPPPSQSSPPQPTERPRCSTDGAAPEEEEEEEEEVEDEGERQQELQRVYDELAKEDDREHMNIVFIGHVDAGKSTIGGQILYLTGGVDERTIQKYEREAKEKNRESWYMAYIMDTNEEERAKGKTVEVGRAHFETEKKRYTVLDAPGHKNYVPNMIGGAAQADVGMLVISARRGEFETGFERGGQTREHAQLAKTLGVTKLVVAVNKMDDTSIVGPNGEWSKERYDEIQLKITPFLKGCGYNPKKDLAFVPISGLLGHNIRDPVAKNICSWYSGGTLFSILDSTEPFERDPLAPFRMPIIDKYKDMGTIVMGKSEAGLVRKGDRMTVMPNKVAVTVTAIYRDDNEVSAAKGGENLRLRLTGIDEDDIAAGFVVCSPTNPVPAVTYFNAQLQILELLEHKAIFTAGYKAVLHVHAVVEECEITKLIAQMDPRTKEKKKVKFVKSGTVAIVQMAVEKAICVELFSDVPQLGRFTLRDEGRTIAIGKITKLPKSLKADD